jgi:hypothetical protein
MKYLPSLPLSTFKANELISGYFNSLNSLSVSYFKKLLRFGNCTSFRSHTNGQAQAIILLCQKELTSVNGQLNINNRYCVREREI